MNVVAVIPARLGSTRLPEKALLHESGKYLVQHVWERVRNARTIARTIVATDHERIAAAVRSFGGEVVMTAPTHPSGTDRVAEVARTIAAEGELVVNVQGDEPEIDGADLDLLVDALATDHDCAIATLSTPFRSAADAAADSTVKVVVDAAGRALYFSRSLIPHGAAVGGAAPPAKHRGVYAFRREALLAAAGLPVAALERQERLEQLRWLHHGLRIRVVATPRDGIGIDTPEDYRRFLQRAAQGG
ncbi:MAG: 3-deoxy-manno-octulosonate cytidylyltransferase [Planctomycetes bacterium]|nr:3-deoxy-manno-octulosonate cytidylyltransferase [Planctomycetota bacterium]